jgi:hypothetical protein
MAQKHPQVDAIFSFLGQFIQLKLKLSDALHKKRVFMVFIGLNYG